MILINQEDQSQDHQYNKILNMYSVATMCCSDFQNWAIERERDKFYLCQVETRDKAANRQIKEYDRVRERQRISIEGVKV